MQSFLRRLTIAAALLCGPSLPIAQAQDAPQRFETGRELLASPDQYLNKSVSIHIGYCFFDDTNTNEFVCIGDSTPFEVVASSIPSGAARDAIKSTCNDIQGVEHNPSATCAYSFNFVPTSYKTIISDYVLHDRVQSNKRIIQFRAGVLQPFK